MAAHGLQQGEGAHQVRLDERRGVQQRVVVVGLRGEVDDRIGPGHDAVDQIGVGDVALDNGQARRQLGGNVGQGRAVARVGELVQDDDVDVRVVLEERMNEIRSDKAGAAGHDDLHGFSPLRARGACRVVLSSAIDSATIMPYVSTVINAGQVAGWRRRRVRTRRRWTNPAPRVPSRFHFLERRGPRRRRAERRAARRRRRWTRSSDTCPRPG